VVRQWAVPEEKEVEQLLEVAVNSVVGHMSAIVFKVTHGDRPPPSFLPFNLSGKV
jgi:hypothetical protein